MAVFGSMRLLINRLITKDKELGTKHPLIYPLVKMALLFLLLQFSVHIMFYLTQAEFEESTEPSHPPNELSSVFPYDHTPLIDVQDGSFKTLYGVIGSVDVAMVMLYTPWCVQCVKLAKVFVEAARRQNEVQFVGINCWLPSGDCRRAEGASMLPRILLYRRHIMERVEYFGDRSLSSLLSFSKRLVRPLTYFTSEEHVNSMLGVNELLVLGHFHSFNSFTPKEYVEFYLAGLLALQTDHSNKLYHSQLMGVVTSKTLAVRLSLPRPPSISLMGWKRGIIEIYQGVWSHEKIYNWLMATCTQHKLVREFLPIGNMASVLTTPISLLFVPLTAPDNDLSYVISQYHSAAAAAAFHRSPAGFSICSDLRHLSHTSCTDHTLSHISLPLCDHTPLSLCPRYSPLHLNRFIPSSKPSKLFCQDFEGGITVGAWPPPCSGIDTSFYIVDSAQYWALAESVGVVYSPKNPFLLFIDFKSQLQYFFPVDVNTSHLQYDEMFEQVLTGRASPLFKSGCGHKDALCPSSEITSAQFNNLMLPGRQAAVLLVHYVTWCATCVHLWPVIHSITEKNKNHTHLRILRINGDFNDIPPCHAPSHYPGIALYPPYSSRPLWYPISQTLSTERITQFIRSSLPINDTRDLLDPEEDRGAGQWEGMGWHLWEISEKEKRSLEQKNQRLAEEVWLLRHRLQTLEQQRGGAQEEAGGVTLDSLVNQVLKLMNAGSMEGVVNKDPETIHESDHSPFNTGHSKKDVCDAGDCKH